MTAQQRLATREFFGIKLGLETIGALVEALGHPERAFVPIIVAGTNGKGSVTAMVARALHAARLRVGRYTSPHLVHLRERYAIGEVDVDDAALDSALQTVFDAEDALLTGGTLAGPATYFELTTAAAFVLFRSAGVQVAVIEVGLGGRYDATNVVRAPYAVITSIALDHMAQLGNTLGLIAAEKAGVVMPDAIVVSGVGEPEAASVIAEVCAARHARLVQAAEGVTVDAIETRGATTLRLDTPWRRYGPVTLALSGAHQVANAVVAVRLLEVLEAHGVGGGREAITTGLREARWPGRIERRTLPSGAPVVLDGAHNPAGATALAHWLRTSGFAPVTLVAACMRDKDVAGLLAPLLPLVSRVVATAVDFPRALPADDLAAAIAALAPDVAVESVSTPAAAMTAASEGGARVAVAGSLFLVGAVRAWLDEHADARDPA